MSNAKRYNEGKVKTSTAPLNLLLVGSEVADLIWNGYKTTGHLKYIDLAITSAYYEATEKGCTFPTRTAVQVFEFGASKYGADNWREGMNITTIIDSLGRHLLAVASGELIDKESGLHHYGHVIANLVFLKHYAPQDRYNDWTLNRETSE